MDDEKAAEIDEIWNDLLARVEAEGVASASVKDGVLFVFSVGHLERMLVDAKKTPHQKVVVFVKNGPLYPKGTMLS
jgi:hypothetical protein